jgi:UDP:flavonoid glycosyltransferase YjiC (YdhE family)
MGYWLADRLILDPALGPSLEKLRGGYGLPRRRRYMDRWWLSPDLVVAMYPDWFAPESRTVAFALTHAGFPLDDGPSEVDRPCLGVADALSRAAEERPIVFTSGTAHRHGRRFFEQAVQSCAELGRPGLLLSRHEVNIPPSLPPLVRSADYLPLGRLLPRVRAIVHHGGIGTTSQALASGVPQVIRPHAFDQFDHAARVERLGCGVWLRRDSDSSKSLRLILESEETANRCREVASRFSKTAPGGAELASAAIDALFRTRSEHAPGGITIGDDRSGRNRSER